jgi:hypothetical protein
VHPECIPYRHSGSVREAFGQRLDSTQGESKEERRKYIFYPNATENALMQVDLRIRIFCNFIIQKKNDTINKFHLTKE